MLSSEPGPHRWSGREARQASGQGWSPAWEESGPLCVLCIVSHEEEKEERQESYCDAEGEKKPTAGDKHTITLQIVTETN